MNNDTQIACLIYGAALLRGLAAGAISVLAAVYLAKRGFDEAALGSGVSALDWRVCWRAPIFGTFFADKRWTAPEPGDAFAAGRYRWRVACRPPTRCGLRRSRHFSAC